MALKYMLRIFVIFLFYGVQCSIDQIKAREKQTVPIDGEKCFNITEKFETWDSGHSYCRSRGSFLPSEKDLKIIKAKSSLLHPIWTGLPPSWMREELRWFQRYPELHENDKFFVNPDKVCPAWNFEAEKFEWFNCSTLLQIVCVKYDYSYHEGNISQNIILTVESNFQPIDSWIETSSKNFNKLILKCIVRDSKSKAPINNVPIYWLMNGEILYHRSSSLQPSTVYIPTNLKKNLAFFDQSEAFFQSTKQGVYYCATWKPLSSIQIESEPVLITKKEWETVVISLNMNNADSTKSIEEKFLKDFKFIMESVNIQLPKSVSGDESSEISTLTYYIHLRKSKYENNKKEIFSLILNTKENLNVTLLSKCLKQEPIIATNVPIYSSNDIGHVYNSEYKCEITENRLAMPKCSWGMRKGAHITQNFNCQRFEKCPRNFKTLSKDRDICVRENSKMTWIVQFQGYENSINKDLLMNVALDKHDDYTVTWMPIRRTINRGPFFDFLNWKLFNDKNQSNWMSDYPKSNDNCVVLDILKRKFLTKNCENKIPNVELKRLNTLEINGNINFNPCQDNWDAFQMSPQKVSCLKMLNSSTSSFKKAKQLCWNEGAQLPFPGKKFNDWYYRKFLMESNYSSIWIDIRREEIRERQFDYLNWLPFTNFSKPYGLMNRIGWYMTEESATEHNIVCEKYAFTETLNIYLEKQSHENAICVKLTGNSFLIRPNLFGCFLNGNLIIPIAGDNICNYKLELTSQGIYQCYAIKMNENDLIFSNKYEHIDELKYTFVIYGIEEGLIYDPMLHDRAFTKNKNWFTNGSCLEYINKNKDIIKNLHSFLNTSLITINQPFITENFYSFLLEVNIESLLTIDILKPSFEDLRQKLAISIDGGFPVSEKCSLTSVLSTTGCPAEITSNLKTKLTWEETRGSGYYFPKELCFGSNNELYSRQCKGNFLEGYFWEIARDCYENTNNRTLELWKISRPSKLNTFDSFRLENLTSTPENLTIADIQLVNIAFQNVAKNPSVSERIRFDDIVGTLNNMMQTNEAQLQKTNTDDTVKITHITQSFEKIAFKIDFSEEKYSSKENIVSECVKVSENESPHGFIIDRSSKTNLLYSVPYKNDVMTAIVFPETLTKKVNSTQLCFAVFKSSILFQDPTIETKNETVSSQIIMATYQNKTIKNLIEPILLYFRPTQYGESYRCVYWDYEKRNGRGGWSSDGCQLWVKEPDSVFQCHCNHLSNFAILIRNPAGYHFDEPHNLAMKIISLIGCGFSIFGLLMVLCTFVTFRKWRKQAHNKVLANLSLSILCSMVIFVVATQEILHTELICRALSGGLHYFILSSFAWSFIEAFLLFLICVKVKEIDGKKFLWKSSLFGYVLPSIPVISVVLYDANQYGYIKHMKICWMSTFAFAYSFAPFLILTVMANLIVYSFIIKILFCTKVNDKLIRSGSSRLKVNLSIAIWLFFVLGFTWIFGILSAIYDNIILSYLFCIFNSLQGFVVFIFNLCRGSKAKELWRDISLKFSSRCNDKMNSSVQVSDSFASVRKRTKYRLTSLYSRSSHMSTETTFTDSIPKYVPKMKKAPHSCV